MLRRLSSAILPQAVVGTSAQQSHGKHLQYHHGCVGGQLRLPGQQAWHLGLGFYSFSPSSTLCSTLVPGQKVCCSAGGLPIPAQNADGSCASYVVVRGDTCSAIALSNSITVADLEARNTKTWGWAGCTRLQATQTICLNTGSPPMPAAVSGTVCGPQVSGTVKPPAGTDLGLLNPCPLDACCNIYVYASSFYHSPC